MSEQKKLDAAARARGDRECEGYIEMAEGWRERMAALRVQLRDALDMAATANQERDAALAEAKRQEGFADTLRAALFAEADESAALAAAVGEMREAIEGLNEWTWDDVAQLVPDGDTRASVIADVTALLDKPDPSAALARYQAKVLNELVDRMDTSGVPASESIDVRLSTGRLYLNVFGVVAAVEGDPCRETDVDGPLWDKQSLEGAARIAKIGLRRMAGEAGK